MSNAELFAVAQRWAPYLAACGIRSDNLSSFEVWTIAGKIIHNSKVHAKERELTPPGQSVLVDSLVALKAMTPAELVEIRNSVVKG